MEEEKRKKSVTVTVFDKIISCLRWVGMAQSAFFLGAIMVQVFLRYVVKKPIYGLDEWVAFMMIWYSAFGTVIVGWEEGHARIEFLLKKLPKGWKMFWNIVEYMLMILCGVTYIIGATTLFKLQIRTAVLGGIPFSRAYYYALPMGVMGGLLILMGLVRLVEFIVDRKGFSEIVRGGNVE